MEEKRFLTGVIWLIVLVSFMLPNPEIGIEEVIAQQEDKSLKPYSLSDILSLLEKKGARQISEEDILKRIEHSKVDFSLSAIIIADLARAGASDRLIEAIGNSNRDIVITSPTNGESCGPDIEVRGRSMRIKDKHLWVFAHRRMPALKNKWWPQSGVVDVADSGEWVIDVHLGGNQDIGHPFEIRAVWVDKDVHRKMEEWLERSEQTGKYPPIPLPEGTPSAQVTVTRISGN